MTVDGGRGNDRLNTGSGNDLVRGGEGNDRIDGGRGFDILLGQAGDDRLEGGSHRDLLIGGDGSDRISGDRWDDLLIASMTVYDDNDAALREILDEWSQAISYQDRITNLRSNTQVALISGSTVLDDDDRDRLYGDSGRDWFFASGEDRVRNRRNEQID